MEKTNKVVLVRRQTVGSLRIVREHYLREDVPCQSVLCLADCQHFPGSSNVFQLPASVTHYVVPDVDCALNFLEIFEIPEITGIVFMQTVSHVVQYEGGRKLQRRLKGLVKDPAKHSVIFYNEFQKYCYHPRQPGDVLVEWQTKNVYDGAAWYYNHLAGQIPIVFVTTDPKVKETYRNKTPGVFVILLEEYLKKFWSQIDGIEDLYQSLTFSLEESKNVGKSYVGYLQSELLQAGLKSGRYVQGHVNVNKHNAQEEAFVKPSGLKGKKDSGSESDILIAGQAARNRAVHGDLVVVEMLPKNQWQGRSNALRNKTESDDSVGGSDEGSGRTMPTGRVVGMVERKWRDFVASFSKDEQGSSTGKSGKVLVIPFDWRIPKIRISTAQVETLKDHRIVVRIDSWEADSQYPNGHFVRTLGKSGHLETEIAAILLEHDLSAASFSEVQMKEMPMNTRENPYVMDEAEISRRRDLRNSHLIFSIDPKGCEDVDDTLSVRELDNGLLELGVHIADVTYFVQNNSLTDLEAQNRSTTVYLADRRYDMLPAVLSADLCSLLSSTDRFAVSVIWQLDKNFEVVDVWYGRTVIRSRYKLFYEFAQSLHDGANKDEIREAVPELKDASEDELDFRISELRWGVCKLMEVAQQLREKRTQQGAVELEGVEVQVQINENKTTIEDLVPKQPLEIHETIAECMIFANHWVAKKIAQSYPNQALLRHHPPPRQEHFDLLRNCAGAKGFSIETKTNKELAESLDKCVDAKDSVINKVLRTLATQAMSNAEYFSTGSLARDKFCHYGLALDYYTHFTSPIRRYADILVHRLLLAAVGTGDADKLMGNKDLQTLAEHINVKHRAAQNAQKDSLQLFQCLYFKEREEKSEVSLADAVIFQIRANGVLAFVPRYGFKGAVYLKSKDGQVLYVSSEGLAEWSSGSLAHQDASLTVNSLLGSQTYRLFDHITVSISVQQLHAHPSTLRLDLVSRSAYIPEEGELTDSRSTKSSIIRTVRDAAEERSSDLDAVELGENFARLRQQYGQSADGASLYSLFQHFHRVALLENSDLDV